jgi:hypothetical protein
LIKHFEFRDLKHKGMRHGCHCIESRDIGAYDTLRCSKKFSGRKCYSGTAKIEYIKSERGKLNGNHH